jgi:hypothetical protein
LTARPWDELRKQGGEMTGRIGNLVAWNVRREFEAVKRHGPGRQVFRDHRQADARVPVHFGCTGFADGLYEHLTVWPVPRWYLPSNSRRRTKTQ